MRDEEAAVRPDVFAFQLLVLDELLNRESTIHHTLETSQIINLRLRLLHLFGENVLKHLVVLRGGV
jgi:hypothetical protein